MVERQFPSQSPLRRPRLPPHQEIERNDGFPARRLLSVELRRQRLGERSYSSISARRRSGGRRRAGPVPGAVGDVPQAGRKRLPGPPRGRGDPSRNPERRFQIALQLPRHRLRRRQFDEGGGCRETASVTITASTFHNQRSSSPPPILPGSFSKSISITAISSRP